MDSITAHDRYRPVYLEQKILLDGRRTTGRRHETNYCKGMKQKKRNPINNGHCPTTKADLRVSVCEISDFIKTSVQPNAVRCACVVSTSESTGFRNSYRSNAIFFPFLRPRKKPNVDTREQPSNPRTIGFSIIIICDDHFFSAK